MSLVSVLFRVAFVKVLVYVLLACILSGCVAYHAYRVVAYQTLRQDGFAYGFPYMYGARSPARRQVGAAREHYTNIRNPHEFDQGRERAATT